MRYVTFYHTETGVLNGVTCLLSDDSAVELNERLYPGHKAIDHPTGKDEAGNERFPLNHRLHQVDVTTGKIVARTAPLPPPLEPLEPLISCSCPKHATARTA